LIVVGMARPLHDSVIRFASQFLTGSILNNFLTFQESEMIQLSTGQQILAGKVGDTKKKAEAWTKFPDASYIFQHPDPTTYDTPTVIFEVGFTESYEDLLSDMRQWITKSQGSVQLVILVNIKEDVKQLKNRKKLRQRISRVRSLLHDYGNAKGIAMHQDTESSQSAETEETNSDAEMYAAI
jgi:hypothetical protein